MSENNENVKELNPSEIEKVAGGNIFDDVACFIVGHDWDNVCQICSSASDIIYVHYKCTRCGANLYQRVDTRTNQRKDISGEEFRKNDPTVE